MCPFKKKQSCVYQIRDEIFNDEIISNGDRGTNGCEAGRNRKEAEWDKEEMWCEGQAWVTRLQCSKKEHWILSESISHF